MGRLKRHSGSLLYKEEDNVLIAHPKSPKLPLGFFSKYRMYTCLLKGLSKEAENIEKTNHWNTRSVVMVVFGGGGSFNVL